MPPRSNDQGRDGMDYLNKPKPGQKPKPQRPTYQNAPQVQARATRTVVPTPDQQKLILCRYYEQGLCERGAACWFAHGRDELRHPHKHASRQQANNPAPSGNISQEAQEQCPDEALFKTRMCAYFQQGRCQRGTACTFAHDPAELQRFDRARRGTAAPAPSNSGRTLDQFLPQQFNQASSVSNQPGSERPAGVASSLTGSAAENSPRAAPRSSPQRRAPMFAPHILDNTPSPTSSNGDGQGALNGIASVPSELEFRPISETDGGTENGGYENAGHANENGHANGNGTVGIESSLGDLSLGGGDSNDPEHPESFCCPITTELLVDPVVAADGHTYERHEITEWLKTKDSSPMTNERMDHKFLIPNLALRAIMDAYFGC